MNLKQISPVYEKAIKGYYLNLETFISLHHSENSYYLPSKRNGNASENEIWTDYKGIENQITTCIKKSKRHCAGKNMRELICLFYCLVVDLV
jgi:hypothetical protein